MGITDLSSEYNQSSTGGGGGSGGGGGFLGFRSRHAAPSSHHNHTYNHYYNRYGHGHGHGHGHDQDEAISVVSVATSHNFWGSANEQERKKKNTSAVSVVSDLSLTSVDNVCNIEEAAMDLSGNEFVIQCQNGDMLFVANAHAKIIKARCRHFRLLLATGQGGHVFVPVPNASGNKKNDQPEQQTPKVVKEDGRILHKETWSIGTARHVIELLTEGTTWIENDHRHFRSLSKACEEIDVKLCLGSLINYHDILDQDSTFRFFDLISLRNYQFKFQAVVTSWQWMHLLHRGILLLPKSKVLMITVAPPNGGTPLLPTSPQSTTTKISPSLPNQQRLAKCDTLCSEFCVYSTHGSKINALLAILDFLSKSKTDDATTTTEAKKAKRKMAKGMMMPEQFQVVYQTRIGSIEPEDLNMLWRLTSASYTLSTLEERQYLPKTLPVATKPESDDPTTPTLATASNTSNEDDEHSLTSHEEPSSLPNPASDRDSPTPLAAMPATPVMPTLPSSTDRYQFRTITGTSCMVLQHLFAPLNSADKDSLLPASLVVSNPSPDTLGRFMNAAAHAKRKKTKGSNTTTATVGWDIAYGGQMVFYVSSSTKEIKDVVEYLSDYNHSAIVNGGKDDNNNNNSSEMAMDFRFEQFVAGGSP
jgi:hypothetical protein